MPVAHGQFFYFSVCHVCKDYSQEIRRCSSCKTVAYCSQKHQKQDWKNHKSLCRAIAATLKYEKIANFEEWKRYRLWCRQVWARWLSRDLEPFECQMWMFPRACNTCYARENLTDCWQCYNVAYCCQKHKEQDSTHAKFCSKLKLCLDTDKYLLRKNACFSLEFNDNITIPSLLSLDITKLLNIIEGTQNTRILEGVNEKIELILKEDCLSPGATILYATEMSHMQVETHLILHIVGASTLEATSDWRLTTETILHRMRNVQTVTYILIGPEAWYMPSPNVELCDACKRNQKSFDVKVYVELYHDIVHTLAKPNLVIAFNSGFHEFETHENSWQKSIPLLLNHPGVPLAFTSYTKDEMFKDLQYVQDIPNVNISILRNAENPFASTRPVRDWCSKDAPVFFSSSYITLCKRL